MVLSLEGAKDAFLNAFNSSNSSSPRPDGGSPDAVKPYSPPGSSAEENEASSRAGVEPTPLGIREHSSTAREATWVREGDKARQHRLLN